jgi:precorrin-6A synthase
LIELFLIGIGTGNPDHLTRAGEKAIRNADLILIPRKGSEKSDLADIRRDICASVFGAEATARLVEFDLPIRAKEGEYLQTVDDWHDAIAHAWEEAIGDGDQKSKRVALLIWGDPSLYDSSLRIAARLKPEPRIKVIPGITALQALTAAHAIPLNEIGAPVLITTGRRLRDEGWPKDADTVAVMLDGNCSFQTLKMDGIHIWWGAFLGMANEVLLSGPLAKLSPQVIQQRASAREEHGWIMDIYVLRRGQTPADSESDE